MATTERLLDLKMRDKLSREERDLLTDAVNEILGYRETLRRISQRHPEPFNVAGSMAREALKD